MHCRSRLVWDHVAQYITNHENMAPSKTHDPLPSQQTEFAARGLMWSATTNQCGDVWKNTEASEMKRQGLVNTRRPHDFTNSCSYWCFKLKSVSISEKNERQGGREVADIPMCLTHMCLRGITACRGCSLLTPPPPHTGWITGIWSQMCASSCLPLMSTLFFFFFFTGEHSWACSTADNCFFRGR